MVLQTPVGRAVEGRVERVKDHKFLYIQEGVYYFRRTVPQGLRQAFGGKTAVVVSLRDYALGPSAAPRPRTPDGI